MPAIPPWLHGDSRSGPITLDVHVQPGASRTEVCGEHGGRLKIRLAARPVNGEANRALVEFLADRLAVPQRNIQLVRGQSSRAKCLQIAGAAPDRIATLMTP